MRNDRGIKQDFLLEAPLDGIGNEGVVVRLMSSARCPDRILIQIGKGFAGRSTCLGLLGESLAVQAMHGALLWYLECRQRAVRIWRNRYAFELH
jgi:hypothetical protein